MSSKLVIFDCDGVLKSTVNPYEILSRSLTRYGLFITLEECLKLFLDGTKKTVAKTASDKGAALPSEWITEIYANLEEGVPIIDGIPYCVASNGSVEKMNITLGHTGLFSRFNGRFVFCP